MIHRRLETIDFALFKRFGLLVVGGGCIQAENKSRLLRRHCHWRRIFASLVDMRFIRLIITKTALAALCII